MKIITQTWLNYAEIDLQTCKKLIDDEFLTNSVAFHAQQVVEKCFKAVLEENELKVLRIHNLMRLFDELKDYINYTVDEDMLEKIDTVYTEVRYPGDIGMLPEGKPSLFLAKEFYEFSDYIYKNTKALLLDSV